MDWATGRKAYVLSLAGDGPGLQVHPRDGKGIHGSRIKGAAPLQKGHR